MASLYSELLTVVRREGLLRRRATYYRVAFVGNLVVFALAWLAFLAVGDSWYQVVTAILLAASFAQIVFLLHDAGHRQVTKSRGMNDLIGTVLGAMLLGFSYSWWMDKHHRHHIHPNQEGKDPDIINKFVAFTPAQARSGLRRHISRVQAYLFLPFALLQAGSMHVHSVRAVLVQKGTRRVAELFLISLHAVAYLGATLLTLAPLKAAVFIAIHQGMLGLYLVCAFAPNHKGMPILCQADELDFLRRQVLTSRNVTGGRIIDFAFGGLNYQIEHHLFPAMARPNLRLAQPVVRAFCVAHGIPYVETSAGNSLLQVVTYLHGVGRSGQASWTESVS